MIIILNPYATGNQGSRNGQRWTGLELTELDAGVDMNDSRYLADGDRKLIDIVGYNHSFNFDLKIPYRASFR